MTLNTTSDDGPAAGLGLVARLAIAVACLWTFWVTCSTGVLYLSNVYGPLGEHGAAGALAGLGCGAVAALVVFVVALLGARRSRALLAVLVVVVCLAGWVLRPRDVDVWESWTPQSNPRWSCTGWSFEHYPPGVNDGSSTLICVGLEKRISDG